MSKLSIIERNKKRIKMYNKFKTKRNKLLKLANNKKLSPDEQFQARLQLSKIPRNASNEKNIDKYTHRYKTHFLCSLTISMSAPLRSHIICVFQHWIVVLDSQSIDVSLLYESYVLDIQAYHQFE